MSIDARDDPTQTAPRVPGQTASPSASVAGERLRFLRGFLRRPLTVASVVPSSRYLIRRVVDAAIAPGTRIVVELGPGTGVVTRELLRALPADTRLLALELDADFVHHLSRVVDPRLIVQQGDASQLAELARLHGLRGIDAIVSGIPFSTLGPELGGRIVQAAWHALAPGGRFVAYQFRPQVAALATPVFGAPDTVFEPRNVPPMTVYRWRRAAH